MGSARVTNIKPMDGTDKKSIKTFLRSIFGKKKEKPKIEKHTLEEKSETRTDLKPIQNANTVDTIIKNFNTKLNLEEAKPKQPEKSNEPADEFENFTFKVIEESRNERIHSQSSTTSGDSGFSDNKDAEKPDKTENEDRQKKPEENSQNTKQTDELVENLEKLGLEDDGKRKKKFVTVIISRTPIRKKVSSYTSSALPYPAQEQDKYNKISSINKHTLSGGQVLVNQVQTDNFSEVKLALESVQRNSQYLQNDSETYLQDLMELIHEDTNTVPNLGQTNLELTPKRLDSGNSYLSNCEESIHHGELMQLLQESYQPSPESLTNPVDQICQDEFTQMFHNFVQKEYNASCDEYASADYAFPTPPRSDTVPSPASFCTFSPSRSPLSDYEKYQEIPHFDEEREAVNKKLRERTNSTVSLTMKQYKDIQKDIAYCFAKRDCCQVARKSCKELLQEHLEKIKASVKKNMCIEVSKMDLKEACGVLHHILINLATSSDNEDVHFALFGLVCERMLAQDPAFFVGDGCLSLLKSAALRCPHRPFLTRYLVHCVRTVINSDATLVANKEQIFNEVDALGDNLVIACARAGDRCSDVLSELVRTHENQPPLFKVNHTNADGCTALHVACSQHSATNSRLQTVHVLLAHGGFDITDGELKGGDTALHLAVNSANCDLQLVLLMFNQLPRKEWKSLAHHPNLSTKTPLDLARLAAKTSTRQNYPQEVLEFLKKCR